MSVNASDQRRMCSTGEAVVMVGATDDAESLQQRQIAGAAHYIIALPGRTWLTSFRRAMAGDRDRADRRRCRYLDGAAFDRAWATRAKRASRYRVERRRRLARRRCVDNPARAAEIRRAREKRLRVRVQRSREDCLLRTLLDRLAEIHDEHCVGNVTDDLQ